MYFRDRTEAGFKLAEKLRQYRFENTAVMALSDGGVVVGWEIARQLHATLSLLVTDVVAVEGDMVVGAINQRGGFVYNNMISPGELAEYMQEMHGVIEEKKMQKFYNLANLIGEHGEVDSKQLLGRNVIMVADGASSTLAFDAALDFLKPLAVTKTIAAVPVAPRQVVDRLRESCDEAYWLSTPNDFYGLDHYYEDKRRPSRETVSKLLDNVILNWI